MPVGLQSGQAHRQLDRPGCLTLHLACFCLSYFHILLLRCGYIPLMSLVHLLFLIDITFALLSSECTTTTLIDSSSAIYKTTSRLLLSLLACSLPSSRLPFTLTLVLALALRSFQRNRPLLQAAHNLNVPLPLASSKEHQLIRSIRPTRPTLSLDPACIDR